MILTTTLIAERGVYMDTNANMYYALIWNTTLSSKKKIIIQGEKITRSTKLPKDPRMLYGTNNNDIARIVKKDNWMEIRYDIMTQRQSVKFWTEIDEYILSRDIRIIVWQGESELVLPSKQYKIVAPDLFQHICMTCCNEAEDIEWSKNMEEEVINLLDTKLIGNLHLEYNEVVTSIDSIIYRKRVE